MCGTVPVGKYLTRVNNESMERRKEGTRFCQLLNTGNDKGGHVMLVFTDSDRG
jgi:hypothetical protein